MGRGLGLVSLRQRERGLLAGGTQVGKSTLADQLGEDFLERYRGSGARRLIADTKPRYRALYQANGMPAKKLYKRWDHGPVVADSVVTRDAGEMLDAFRMGHRTVIAQARSSRDIPAIVHMIGRFLEDSRRGRPQLLQVDETKDFFHGNGMPKGGDDAIIRVARAGAERGTSALYCTQRTKGIAPELLEFMDRLYCFNLDVASDAKRFQEFGCPPFALPTKRYQFKYWTKADRPHIWGPYQLEVPR